MRIFYLYLYEIYSHLKAISRQATCGLSICAFLLAYWQLFLSLRAEHEHFNIHPLPPLPSPPPNQHYSFSPAYQKTKVHSQTDVLLLTDGTNFFIWKPMKFFLTAHALIYFAQNFLHFAEKKRSCNLALTRPSR